MACGLVVMTLIGCAPRGTFSALPVGATPGTIERIYVATERGLQARDGATFGNVRSDELRFGTVDVSVPQQHVVGQIEWPKGAADPVRHFVVSETSGLDNLDDFVRQVQADQTEAAETLVFVHGFNVNNAEAVYRLAQIRHDYGIPVPTVAFSWPSAGHPAAYVYDRDSVIFARDGLEKLITALVARKGQKVVLVAHSMGSQLVMEVLRQLTIAGRQDVLGRVESVALISPDIDPDVFQRQMDRIDPIPPNFTLFTSSEDIALGLSSILVGRKARLGAINTAEEVAGLPVTVVDLSNLADGEAGNHLTLASSPAAVAFVGGLIAAGQLETGSQPRVIRAPASGVFPK
ncbi:alpha/beta hydrolase [Algirhabdus cladophorae]|uniref:alpha/beta hydrolase n=1 Tax=Algirhabdus cladophorae TaxID=3377108 RepID=UPI003B8482CC